VTDFLRPVAWYERWRTIQSMRRISTTLEEPGLHELTEKADSAAAVEDDRQFLEAVATFLERWAQSRR